jgi:octaprenyl-diphosphate synthase
MPSDFENPVTVLHNNLAQEMLSVNRLILERLQSKIPLVEQVAYHLIQAGGKRIRPLLTLACSRLFSTTAGYALNLAAAVELIHTATLLHDDVIDESDLRRDKPTANYVWGDAPSILVGDFLFSKSFQLMVEAKNLRVLEILSQASAHIAEGEVLQLTVMSDFSLKLETYLEIIGSKTASLFAAACQAGGMIANMPTELETDLYQFGYNLGIAFQIADDILDYIQPIERASKTAGIDFYEGKLTLPVLLICQEPQYSQTWQHWFQQPSRSVEDFKAAQKSLHQQGVFEKCRLYSQPFIELATKHLLKLPTHAIRDDLENLIQYCLNRSS